MLIPHRSLLCLMPESLMDRAKQHDPHREEHMKDSLACLSCAATLTGCITVLCLYLKQARGTKEKRYVWLCACVFWLMRGWIQVSTLERRNSLMRVILEMQMTARAHIHRWKMESSSVLITLWCLLWIPLSVSTLSRRDCLVWKVDYTCSKAWGGKYVN